MTIMKLTKSKLKQIIKEELQKTLLKERNGKCGPKPVWPGNKAASLKFDPTGNVMKDQRAWYNCKKRKRALPKEYPFAEQNRKKQQQPAETPTKPAAPAAKAVPTKPAAKEAEKGSCKRGDSECYLQMWKDAYANRDEFGKKAMISGAKQLIRQSEVEWARATATQFLKAVKPPAHEPRRSPSTDPARSRKPPKVSRSTTSTTLENIPMKIYMASGTLSRPGGFDKFNALVDRAPFDDAKKSQLKASAKAKNIKAIKKLLGY